MRSAWFWSVAGLSAVLLLAGLALPFLGSPQLGIWLAVAGMVASLIASVLHRATDWRSARIQEPLPTDHWSLVVASLLHLIVIWGTLLALELLSLSVYLGAIPADRTVEAVALGFGQILTAISLGILPLWFLRRRIPSSMAVSTTHQVRVWSFVAFAGLFVVAWVVLALDLVAIPGLLDRQEIHVLGVSQLFLIQAHYALLRVPMPWHILAHRARIARKAHEPMRQAFQKRAMAAYAGGLLFVAASMALIGTLAAGALPTGGQVGPLLLIVYGGIALGVLFLILLNVVQLRNIPKTVERTGEVEAWVQRVLNRRKDPAVLRRILRWVGFGTLALAAAILGVLHVLEVFVLPWLGWTDYVVFTILFLLVPVIVDNRIRKANQDAWDEVWPDFLGDVAEMTKAGMTLPRALDNASKGDYGTLTPYLQRLALQVAWGVPFSDALLRFQAKHATRNMKRSISLILEANRAGGDVSQTLQTASQDARSLYRIVQERGEQMAMYGIVVWISFAVFLLIVIVLATRFIPAFDAATQQGAQNGGFQGLLPESIDRLGMERVLMHAALIQALTGGLVSGVLVKGRIMAGAMTSFAMLLVAWLILRLGVGIG